MSKKVNWYGLDMLPLYLSISENQLQASIEHLQTLKACVGRTHVLNDEMINRILKAHKEQNETTWVVIEQYQKWQKQNPNQNQMNDIKQLEKNTYDLEKVNKQVLDLTNDLKNSTIDKIFQKDDIDLALDFLLGKREKQ